MLRKKKIMHGFQTFLLPNSFFVKFSCIWGRNRKRASIYPFTLQMSPQHRGPKVRNWCMLHVGSRNCLSHYWELNTATPIKDVDVLTNSFTDWPYIHPHIGLFIPFSMNFQNTHLYALHGVIFAVANGTWAKWQQVLSLHCKSHGFHALAS